jgi:hypothetical protein
MSHINDLNFKGLLTFNCHILVNDDLSLISFLIVYRNRIRNTERYAGSIA